MPPPKSYRDAAMPRSSSAVGASVHPSVPPAAMVEETGLSSAQVELLQQRFPHQVTISTEKFAASTSAWSNALIGKCLGREIHADGMSSALSSQWSTVGEWELFPMTNGFYVFRFASPEARDEVLLGGPWIVEGAVLALSQFDPAFRSSADQVLRAVLWVRLPELPPGFWADDIISDILMVVGRVVRLDDHTRLRTRGRFARAAVEVDLRQPLLPGVTVGVENAVVTPFWQVFQYENVHNFCFRCRRVGHKALSCTASQPASDEGPSMDVDAATSDVQPTLPSAWAASLMVRRSRRLPVAEENADHRRHEKTDRARISKLSNGAHSRVLTQSAARGPTSVGEGGKNQPSAVGPTHVTERDQSMPHKTQPAVVGPTHVGERDKKGPANGPAHVATIPVSTGLADHLGPSLGLFSPFSHTSATGPKPTEPSSSAPSPLPSAGLPVAGDGFGGNAMDEVCSDEDRLIREIMLENADYDEEVQFAVAGKKKKHGKDKMTEVCLRLEPRNRTLKKKVRVGGGYGRFSLLHDLASNTSLQELADMYGPDMGTV